MTREPQLAAQYAARLVCYYETNPSPPHGHCHCD